MLGDLWGDLARGIATVTAAPARAAGLTDRGRLEPGLRADVIRVARIGGAAVLRGTWVAGPPRRPDRLLYSKSQASRSSARARRQAERSGPANPPALRRS